MKKRFKEEQLACALKRNATVVSVAEICREMGVSDASFYKRKQKYAGCAEERLYRGNGGGNSGTAPLLWKISKTITILPYSFFR